jgi:hypothetical protein
MFWRARGGAILNHGGFTVKTFKQEKSISVSILFAYSRNNKCRVFQKWLYSGIPNIAVW